MYRLASEDDHKVTSPDYLTGMLMSWAMPFASAAYAWDVSGRRLAALFAVLPSAGMFPEILLRRILCVTRGCISHAVIFQSPDASAGVFVLRKIGSSSQFGQKPVGSSYPAKVGLGVLPAAVPHSHQLTQAAF